MTNVQVVYRGPGDDEKSTLYVQAVYADQQMSWIREIRKGTTLYLLILAVAVSQADSNEQKHSEATSTIEQQHCRADSKQ